MAGDGVTPFQSGGAGGKFQKRTIRRSAQATPYDRPITAFRNNNNPSIFSKLANPASRLLYAGADRLFGVFRKRLPSIPAQLLPEPIEEPRNGLHEAGPDSGSKNATEVLEPSTDEERNLASISAATEISEIENVFKQKTFTRSEIERLKALLDSKTTESDVCEGDKAKFLSTTSHVSKLDASTSGTLNKHDLRENFHSAISTPVVNSRAFDEDVASPAELAKAYMGTRSAKVLPSPLRLASQPPRQDSAVLNYTTTLLRTPIASPPPRTVDSFKGYENRLKTPRSQGRIALYNMAYPTYNRGTSAFSQKGNKSDNDHGVASPSLTWERKGTIGSSKMAGKRRNSELDDIRSGGPIRIIRQKSNLLMQVSKQRSEIGSSAQRLLLRNEPDPKGSKAVKENGERSYHNLDHASVPTKSTEMASKIFEQLERMSPKEKPSVSRFAGMTEKLATKSTSNMSDKVESPKFLPNFQPDGASTSQSNNKVEENGQRMSAVPRNAFSSMNGNSTVPSEPPPKKRAFQMSAYEESVELDEDNHSNGQVSVSLGENKKPESSVFANKVSNDPPAEVIQNHVLPEVTSSPKTDFGSSGGSFVNKQKIGSNFPTSSPSSNYTQSSVLSQSNSVVDTASLQKEPTVTPKFGTSTKSAEKVSPYLFSANEPFGVERNISPGAKPFGSTSSFTENNQVQFSAFNKDNNGNAQKSVNMFGTSEPFSSASPTNPSASGSFSFGGSNKNSSITNGTSAVVAPLETGASKSNNFSSLPFASTLFSSEAATSTTDSYSQGSLFNGTNFQANTQTSTAVIQTAPFKLASGTSGISPFGSFTPSFGLGSAVTTSEFKSGSSTSKVFGSGFGSTPSFGPSSTSGSTTSIFGSTAWQPPQSAAATNTSFPTPSPGQSVFGNSTPVFGAPNNNNDQMSMEDSMAEDTARTPSPSVPAVAQASAGSPGFMFGSTTPTPSTTTPFQFGSQTSQPLSQNPSTPFQFGSQTSQPPSQNPWTPFQFASQISQPPSQNPFQASGGSFSLGSGGGGDKSGRRIIKAKRRK